MINIPIEASTALGILNDKILGDLPVVAVLTRRQVRAIKMVVQVDGEPLPIEIALVPDGRWTATYQAQDL